MPIKRGRKPNMEECKVKALGEYLEDTSHTEFAKTIGISQPMLSLILKGERQAPLRLCNIIIQETRLEVKFIDLRPDLYDDLIQIGKSIMEES